MSDTPASPSSAGVSLYDARPFFEKALQYGLQHGLIPQTKLDEIARSAPKGMVQIAAYFGSEFLRPELERARDRIVNLVSLYLEDSCDGDLRRAAESLRDHSFLSRSKGGSDMLKRLIVMPQTSHFGMNERKEFSDVHIPQLAKWTLRPLAEYRAELARRTHAAQLMAAAEWLAEDLGLDEDELSDAGPEAEAVIRTALLVLSTGHTEMPDWRALGAIVLKLRQRHGEDASGIRITVPAELPVELHPVVENVRRSVMRDLPKMLDAATPIRKLFQQTPAFMGRYFWLDSGLAEVDAHERTASATWKKITAGNDDEPSLLTLFLCVAAESPPKTLLTERMAGTLIRKIRKSGWQPELAEQYIQAHAPAAYQADYLKLWHSFVDEARAPLTRDVDDGIQNALTLLRRECHVKAS
ncbi:hypothetical protein WIT60_02340 [Aquabacterium sp. G14]|uniref:hypothetical protein n=1 Tax=Aquabacterium sp. G14 TaxID=3130164 RepID=UPI0030AEFAE8